MKAVLLKLQYSNLNTFFKQPIDFRYPVSVNLPAGFLEAEVLVGIPSLADIFLAKKYLVIGRF